MPDPYAPSVRAVVKAVDKLTTQVRRIADHITTPVADDTDAEQTTPDNGRRVASWLPLSPELAAQRAETWSMLERYIDGCPPCIPDHGAPVHCPGCAADNGPTALSNADRRSQYGQVLRHWGLLDEVNDPATAEAFAVTDLLALANAEQHAAEERANAAEAELTRSENARDILRTRAEQAEDLLRVAHETSNRSEVERVSAVRRAEQAEARRDELAATLHDVLRHFVHKGHPGEPCLQTGWIAEKTVARWRAVLYPPATEEQ